MERIKKCIHQIMRPDAPILREGVGNCLICQPHSDNEKCASYYGINWWQEEDNANSKIKE